MIFFEKYTSNTIAGSGNQSFFNPENPDIVYTGRVLYKVGVGGEFNYSILFSNIIDSTFADGSHSQCNRNLDEWTITEAKIGVTSACDMTGMQEPKQMHTLTFGKSTQRLVASGEIFHSDPITLSPQKGEYICLEISFKGNEIPHHPESIIPSFLWNGEAWQPSKALPFPSMIGCNRSVRSRIAFFGDSITQGIGVEANSYAHWNSLVTKILGDEYAYWNLGLGYGRAADAATDGAWLFKAKQNDIVVVCFGVNDISRDYSAEEIKDNLEYIVDTLHASNIKLVLQSVPPFNYNPKRTEVWNEVNSYIHNTLAKKADFFFDVVPYLQKSEQEPNMARFGGHPNADGCEIWGNALGKALNNFFSAQV